MYDALQILEVSKLAWLIYSVSNFTEPPFVIKLKAGLCVHEVLDEQQKRYDCCSRSSFSMIAVHSYDISLILYIFVQLPIRKLQISWAIYTRVVRVGA